MSLKPTTALMDFSLINKRQRACLSLAVVGLLLSAPVQAVIPTPESLVTTGELAFEPSPAAAESLTEMPIVSASSGEQAKSIPNVDVDDKQNKQAEALLAEWRYQVKEDHLAQHLTWRRLLYFLDDKTSLFNKDVSKSLIDDPTFFLSDSSQQNSQQNSQRDGQQDASAEMDAMLVALSEEVAASQGMNSHGANLHSSSSHSKTSANNSVICRFPARTHWLAGILGIDSHHLQADCPAFDDWMTMLAPEQLSVMFAEEYLDSPTSAFAHTLLRIDSKASVADPSQIHHAYALNDTVDGNPDDAFAIYALKSTIGAYSNVIEIDPYPMKLAKYLKDDERDAWTYQLDLTPEETKQIIRHVWETKDLDIPYYFSTDNCASEILRLIDVVRFEQNLRAQLPYAVVPSDVINLLDNEGLLLDARYTPSDSTVRQAQSNKAKTATDFGYRASTKNAARNINSTEYNLMSSMSDDLETVINHGIVASDNNPVDRHPLQMAQVSIGQRGDNSYIDLGLRSGFHDTLDRTSGFPQFFSLEALDARLRFYDTDGDDDELDSLVLENFTVVRGRSFNPINTDSRGKTWGASIEATRVNDGSQESGRDHLVGSVGYESGWSWALGTPRPGTGEKPPQLCYTLLSGQAQAGRGISKGFRVGAGVNMGCRYQINNQLRAQAQLQLPYWYHGGSGESNVHGHYWQPISTLGLQYDIDKKQALRINSSYEWQNRIDTNNDVQLSYRRYF
ncbi:MAG: DUF4105 domain-containing protein [Psychrobacter sp.]|nr:DUF4105 domain-containing protein [Psychrobacter sp.]